MVKVEKVEASNKQLIIDLIKPDIIRHVFAFYDIQKDPEHTTTYAASENGKFKGYVLIYTATDVPSVILECENEVAEKLIEYAPQDHFILHAPSNLMSVIKGKLPQARHYVENWMLVEKGEASFSRSELTRRLRTEKDGAKLATLLLSRRDRPAEMMKKYVDWVRRMPIYGVFVEDELVSYAGSFIQLPQVWMIGGVYTHPKLRSKGYATLATSAITEEALKTAETAALFVRADNYPAIKVYEKIGYRKIGEKVWVDMGTGLRP